MTGKRAKRCFRFEDQRIQVTTLYRSLLFLCSVFTIQRFVFQTIQVKLEIKSSISSNREELAKEISDEKIEAWITNEELRLKKKLEDGGWINEFQGKYIFNRICGEILNADQLRIRHAYVDVALSEKPETLSDIAEMFKGM